MSDTNWAFIALLFFVFLTLLSILIRSYFAEKMRLELIREVKELIELSKGLAGKTAEGKVKMEMKIELEEHPHK